MHFIKDCIHYNTIDDLHNGANVCIDCGLVIENTIFHSINIPDQPSLNSDMHYIQVKEVVENIFEKLNLPEKYVNDITHSYLKHCKKAVSYEKICEEIYKLNAINGLGKSLNEIKSFCSSKLNINPIKHLNNKSSILVINPNDILIKLCSYFNVNEKHIHILLKSHKIQCLIKKTHFNPNTIIGGLIYHYSRNNKLNITMKVISQQVGISVMSLQRFCKLLK